MMRLATALAVFLSLASSASASRSPSQNSLFGTKRTAQGLTEEPFRVLARQFSADSLAKSAASGQKDEFHVNEETEIRLDNRLSSYANVPNDAVITFLEVSSDKSKTILRIHFRSRK
ncbi:MAG TPA: hypothetical protein VK395_07485 [Gemmataceae bacterium]|nr:hypothetical protein [Gemmataceae bacterium]